MNLKRYHSSFLFLVCLLICVNCNDGQSLPKTCIVSGTCGQGFTGPVPCAQSTSPAYLKDKDLQLLTELCPSLAGKFDSETI